MESDDQFIRLECLRFATETGASIDFLTQSAQELFDYVKNGPKAAEVINLTTVTR